MEKYYSAGGEQPHDPAKARNVGRRRGVYGFAPDPNGNRGERRAAAKAAKRRRGMYRHLDNESNQ